MDMPNIIHSICDVNSKIVLSHGHLSIFTLITVRARAQHFFTFIPSWWYEDI